MKTSKKFLISFLSAALSAVMLFGSTSTVFAVENKDITEKSPIYNHITSGSGVMDDKFKAYLAEMDDDDTVVVVYRCNTNIFTVDFMEIDEFAESLGRGDEVEFNEEENIFYATEEMIALYKEYENSQSQRFRDNAKIIRDLIAENFCQSLLYFDIHFGEVHVLAKKAEIEAFMNAQNDNGDYYAEKVYLGNQTYFDQPHGLTWEDYEKMTKGMVELFYEQDQIVYDVGDFFYSVVFDYFEDECMFYSTAFKNDGELIYARLDNKYVYMYRDYGGTYLFYDDGVLKNPAQMYDEGKITLEKYYTLGALLGDVNYDQKVDVSDVTYLQMHLAGYVHTYEDGGEIVEYPYIDPENQSNVMVADINDDLKNDVTDVTYLQMMLAGYELDFDSDILFESLFRTEKGFLTKK